MKWFTGIIDDDGRIEVPLDILEHLAAKSGDRLVFTVQDEGTVIVYRATYPTVASLRGAAGSINTDLTVDEMIEVARNERILRKFGRRDP